MKAFEQRNLLRELRSERDRNSRRIAQLTRDTNGKSEKIVRLEERQGAIEREIKILLRFARASVR